MPSARPRQTPGHVSATSVAPEFHSPPIPKPSRKRNTASIVMLVEKPQAKVNIEYIKILWLNARRRPKRSASKPKPKLPIADASRVSEFKKPAVDFVIPNSRIRVASTIE